MNLIFAEICHGRHCAPAKVCYDSYLPSTYFIYYTSLTDNLEFIHGLSNRSPIYLPFTNPIYSNVAFTILTYAIESIAGNNQQYEDVLNERLLNPLRLSGTSYTKPADNKKGLILSDETGAQGWYEDLGYYGP